MLHPMPRPPAGLLLAILILLPLSGCQGHLQFSAPPRTAPLKERLARYKCIKPAVKVGTGYYYLLQAVDRNFLVLANGQRVHHPEDLLPVDLPAESLQDLLRLGLHLPAVPDY